MTQPKKMQQINKAYDYLVEHVKPTKQTLKRKRCPNESRKSGDGCKKYESVKVKLCKPTKMSELKVVKRFLNKKIDELKAIAKLTGKSKSRKLELNQLIARKKMK